MNASTFLQMSGIVVDLVYVVNKVPVAGEDKVASASLTAPGAGFNAAIAAKRAGMDVVYGGPHGTGLFADYVRAQLETAGIPFIQSQNLNADQGSCVVMVDELGERTFVSNSAAGSLVNARLMHALDPADYQWTLVSGYELSNPVSRDVFHEFMARLPASCTLVIDPAPIHSSIPQYIFDLMLETSGILSANLAEASEITGLQDPAAAARALLNKMGDRAKGVVIRAGADGCWIAEPDTSPIHVPGFDVEVVDTNGAGDTHIGTMIAALDRGASLQSAVAYANAAAALSIQHFGPSTAPLHEETLEFFNKRSELTGRSYYDKAI
ncbi:MAG: PfkB family carbohydrate kinase [Hyphomicrobiales bacterium]